MLATEIPPVPNRRMRALEALAIAALALCLNLAGNGRVGLWDRDEPRYAQCTREMRASGDYIHPTFNGEPRYQKPVLIYWLMLAGTAIGGDNPFGARLISALAGAATCLLVWRVGDRMFGPKVARLAALIFMTAPLVLVNSKLATTDASLAFFLVSCQFALWRLSRAPSPAAAAVFWACLAFATLTKGPVGPVLIGAAGITSWVLGGPSSCWRRLHWRWGLIGFVLTAAPWYVAIGIVSRGDFYRVAVGGQVLRRVTTVMEQHPGFPGYYPATTVLTFYPWSALLPAAIFAGWIKRKSDPTLGFLLGWAIGPMIVLECVRTKLVHYYLPAYPACALLVAWLVNRLAESGMSLRRWPLGRLGSGLMLGLGLSLAVLAVGGVAVLPLSIKWPCLLIALILAAGTLFSSECFRVGRPERATYGLAGTWALTMLAVSAWLLPMAEPYRMPQVVARRLASLSESERARPLLTGFQEPSMIYEFGRPVPVMRDREWLRNLVQTEGAVISAIARPELTALSKDRSLIVDVKETVVGFNLSKGKTERLSYVILRPASVASRTPRR